MKVLACVVQGQSAAGSRENESRVDALDRLLLEIRRERSGIELVVLPGGFLGAAGDPNAAPHLDRALAAIEQSGVPTTFGVDLERKRTKGSDGKVAAGTLGWFAYAWSPRNGRCGPFRQQSSNSRNQALTSLHANAMTRVIDVGRDRVGIVLCGELFNRNVEATMRSAGVQIAANLVHNGAGYRFPRAAERWCSLPPLRAVVMACHAHTTRPAMRYARNGHYDSTRKTAIDVRSPVRIQGAVVDL